MYVYIKSEKACKDNDWHDLFTVGFYDPDGKWQPESDHETSEAAVKRVVYLNGGQKSDEIDILEIAQNAGKISSDNRTLSEQKKEKTCKK